MKNRGKNELADDLHRVGADAGRAELDVILNDELNDSLRQLTKTIDAAAKASSDLGEKVVMWTKVLSVATGALVGVGIVQAWLNS